MSYLKFDKTLMINLQESLSREILGVNQKGAYASSTIVDCNTRKYHGMLIMPVAGLGEGNHVLLSSLDETVIQHGAAFNLGIHKYQGNVFSPNGHKYIREYSVDTVRRTIYRVGGVILSKEKTFLHKENCTMVRYKLLDAHSVTTLRFYPFLAFRSVNDLSKENDYIRRHCEGIDNGIKTHLYDSYPDLFMQFSKPVKFVYEPNWYNGIEYPKEQDRGYPYKEDLYVPGYFELEITKGEEIIFSASDKEYKSSRLFEIFEDEMKIKIPKTNFYNCIVNSIKQLYYNPENDDYYLIAGYPWFKVRARDLFISVCAATLLVGDMETYDKIMKTAVNALANFIKKGKTDTVIHEIDSPDVLLWAIWSMQQYCMNEGLDKAKEKYGSIIGEIIRFIIEQSHPNLNLSDNGLLFSNGRQKAVTWMNSTINGRPAVQRSGFIVEFNALWYNALCFHKELNDNVPMPEIDGIIASIELSFPATFVNRYNYLFDYVDGHEQDWSVRPNMIIATAMKYSPLTRSQKRNVLDIATKELLTPKGIRSLSPKSIGYRPTYFGSQYERDMAYHQGTVWPWLMSFYITTYLDLFGKRGISFVERLFITAEEEISKHCIGTFSELFDGNSPYTGRGATSFLMSLASVINSIEILKKYKTDNN
jgi:predicted glycogen debranching enzyme